MYHNSKLNSEEERLLQKVGIPKVFAEILKRKSLEHHLAFALRATSPWQRYLMPAAPKPLSVKAKTGNWGMTKGVIAVDPRLGKIVRQEGEWVLLERSGHDLPSTPGLLETLVHHISLQELLSTLQADELALANTPEEIRESALLLVKPIKRFPKGHDFIFKINLKECADRLEKQCQIDFTKILSEPFLKFEAPDWWNPAWGDFDIARNTYYPLQYKSVNDNLIYQDLMIYGLCDETRKVLPITGDQDLLWISLPTSKIPSLLKEFEEVIDTSEPENILKLYQARIALHLKLGGKIDDVDLAIRNNSISGLGRVSAYESYVIDDVNQAFSHSGIRHIRDLIQHASENHNAGEMTNLDARMIHVWQGRVQMTYSEKALVRYVLDTAYAKDNLFNVNARWNMDKWSSIVKLQLDLHQPVPIDTLKAYQAFKRDHQNAMFYVPWSKSKGV